MSHWMSCFRKRRIGREWVRIRHPVEWTFLLFAGGLVCGIDLIRSICDGPLTKSGLLAGGGLGWGHACDSGLSHSLVIWGGLIRLLGISHVVSVRFPGLTRTAKKKKSEQE
mmetsp:Transcript_10431/g.21022  ORF Transcript_10431/g.21022 Transcript_10431/m.21022 type:complete len:111 (-) Transcript_10431:1462-1794(-)